MPGGLELAQDGVNGGGVEFDDAIDKLRRDAIGLEPDAVHLFARRANGAYPSWKEMQANVQSELDKMSGAATQSIDELRHPPINRGLPFFHAAAGMLKPTRTGSIGESIGSGIEGYAKGIEENQKPELDFARRAAELGYTSSKDRLTGVEGMYGIGMKSQQLEYALSMMRGRLGNSMLTPAIKEWAVSNGIPVEDILANRIPEDKRADLQRFINLARGSSQIKNAQAMLNPSNPDFANTVKLLSNQSLVGKMMQLAEQHHPMSAYQGQPVDVRNAKVLEEFWNLVRQNSVGATAGAPLPAAGALPGAPGAMPAAPPGPAGAAGAPPAAAVPPVAGAAPAGPAQAPHPFDEFMTPAAFKPNVPGQIQSEQNEASQKAAATAAENRASSYIEKEVNPGLKAADDLRTSAIITKQLLEKDPKLTGSMKPFMAEFGNFLTTLGVAPKRVEQFATDMSLFRSQAMLQVLAKQLEQKGVQTESDAMRIMQAGIDPKKPADANRFMIHFMEATANRLQERSAYFDRWAKKNGGQMAGAVEGWNAYSKKYPMALVRDGKVHFRDVPLPE